MTTPDPRQPGDDAPAGPPAREQSEDAHAAYEQLCAGYALSALEPQEEQQFLRHLLTCARCERDLLEHRTALAHLAYVAPSVPPPAALLEGIRNGVRADPGVDAYGPGAGAVPMAGLPPARAGEASTGDELGRARDRRRLRRATALTSAAAALLLVVGLGAWNVSLQRDRDQQAERARTLATAVAQLQDGPGRTVPLRSDAGQVLLVAVVQDRDVSLVVDDLPANDPATSTYVLWGVVGGDLRGLAAFDVTQGDLDVVRGLPLPASVQGMPAQFLISREQGREMPAAPEIGPLASGMTA